VPQFLSGVVKVAKVTLRNPTGKAFDYHAVLFMGVNQAAVAELDVSLGAGESKQVSFSVTMPSQTGVYPVYLGVYSAGQLLTLYQATENVEIVTPPPFNMVITRVSTATDKYATAYWLAEVTGVISNPHSAAITHRLRCLMAPGTSDPYLFSSYIWVRCWGGGVPGTPASQLYELPVTLSPGQSVTVVSPFYYINGWHDIHGNYEWSNIDLMYKSGVPKKYWIVLSDELGNMSQPISVGSAI